MKSIKELEKEMIDTMRTIKKFYSPKDGIDCGEVIALEWILIELNSEYAQEAQEISNYVYNAHCEEMNKEEEQQP